MAGGVAANKGLRENLTKMCEVLHVDLSFPPMQYCTDNAAMLLLLDTLLIKMVGLLIYHLIVNLMIN